MNQHESRSGLLPADWWVVEDAVVARASRRTHEALADVRIPARLAEYYRRGSSYAGATFLDLEPHAPYAITPGDVLALNTLNVPVGAGAIRRLLAPGGQSAAISQLLASDALRVGADLRTADRGVFEAMEQLYVAVKSAISGEAVAHPNAWVTASTLCARKRPELFPVRDYVVCRHLGLLDGGGRYTQDWLVFRALMSDAGVRAGVESLIARTEGPGIEVGDRHALLRHLDVVLWMHAREVRPAGTGAARAERRSAARGDGLDIPGQGQWLLT
ncbi:MAG TPA: DUF6308 family protein [Candidatus Lustribacter sp.]|nr:DUF6308 family protein [Candidatus Lustribacter sp.]